MVPEHLLKKYYEKSGDSVLTTDNFIYNEHGFSSHRINGENLVIVNVYGDGKYWDNFFVELVKEKGLKKIIFATRRNPAAFKRKFGYELAGFLLEKGV